MLNYSALVPLHAVSLARVTRKLSDVPDGSGLGARVGGVVWRGVSPCPCGVHYPAQVIVLVQLQRSVLFTFFHFAIERSEIDIDPLSVISSGIGAGSVVLSIMISPGMLRWYEYCVTACVTGMWVVGYVTLQLHASRSIMVCRCRGINRLSRPYICSARPGGPGLCHHAE